MDFMFGLPLSHSKNNLVWVIVDRLTKSVHFFPVHTNYPLENLVEFYVSEIVCLHGILTSIVSDRDSRFTSRFWKQLQELLGTKLQFSNSFLPHPKRHAQKLCDGFCAELESYFPLLEFAYNNSIHTSSGMSLFEALYGRKCRSPTCLVKFSEKKLVGSELI
ncbi:Transposon Ty3-I Gag-Pol polyprotein [Gossypium australe]|uniref:Transposon Ty3-I Gag-Pol polyprotein n=1 Tax=Gossypium australe TaxID=47621 RepID=A0A5B6X2R5_9ROSI|nr:Transposon Ty3-I Gag-Pol polyprotein [Gossypium australe]